MAKFFKRFIRCRKKTSKKKERRHSTPMSEDEYYDAVDAGFDCIEEAASHVDKKERRISRQTSVELPATVANLHIDASLLAHPLWPEIEKVTQEQVHYALDEVSLDADGGWHLFFEDNEIRSYKRKQQGAELHPTKLVYTVRGVTAHEICEHFFRPEHTRRIDSNVEHLTVVEQISDDAMIVLHEFRRIWPTRQRDALLWSCMRQIATSGSQATWLVCNHSTERPDYPENTGKCIRVKSTVLMLCQTTVDPPKNNDAEITRNDITTKISYCLTIDPGGWAPPSLIQLGFKTEYPKFLRKLTQIVTNRCRDNPVKL